MNTSMSWIKMYVPDLDVTARCHDTVRNKSGRLRKTGCRSGQDRDRTD